MRARDDPKFFRARDAGEPHEVAQRALVAAPRVRVAEIGEPLELGRHVGELLEGVGGE